MTVMRDDEFEPKPGKIGSRQSKRGRNYLQRVLHASMLAGSHNVARAFIGSRVGRAVLDALMKAARERGDREAVLHAQTSAAAFYSRAGFAARGPEFDEAGIAHVEMVKVL